MNLRWIWMAHLRGMRQHWTRTLLAVLAVGAGAAMLVGVQISSRSILSSLSQFNDRVSFGSAFHIEGPADHGTVDMSVLPRIASTPGVKSAIPLVMTVAQATDSAGREVMVPVLGIDCSAQAIVGEFGCNPAALAQAGDNPAVGPALRRRLGATGALHTNVHDIAATDTFALKQLSKVNHGLIAVFPLPASQRLFTRPNGLDMILVTPTAGTNLRALAAALHTAAGPQNHVYDAQTPIGGANGVGGVTSILTPFLFLISLIGLVIGAQLVRNGTDLSLEERRRDFATSSALGAGPRTIVLGIVAESAIVGVLGSLLAIVGGQVIAGAFVGKLSNEIAKQTGLRASIVTPPSAIVLGVVVALGVSVLASLAPARRASRIDLVAELSGRRRYESDKTASRLGLIVTCAVIAVCMLTGFFAHRGGALDAWQPPATLLALVGSMVFGYVLCVQAAPRLLNLLQRAPWFATGPARVALTNIVRARRRTVAVALAIAAPVFFSVILGGIAPGMAAGGRLVATGNYADRVYVSTLASNNSSGIDSKVTPDMEQAMLAVPGVAGIEHSYFTSFNDPASTWFSIDGFEGAVPHFHVHRGASPDAAFGRGEVMVGPALARSLHLQPGSTLSLPARVGPRQSFVVGGIWAQPNNLGRSVTMRAGQLLALVGPRAASDLSLVAAPGVSTAELAQRITDAHISPRLHIMTTDQLADDFSHEFLKLASPFDALRLALVAVALVATSSTLVLAAVQRRRDNATLAALGMGPGDLARSTVIETVITALTVAFVATVCGQFALVTFTWASAVLTGLAIPYRFAPSPVLTAALATTLIALAGAALPAWRTARTNVMDALRTA